jgi:hypothetical protein
MSTQQSRFEQILERYGSTATLYSRNEFDGVPSAQASNGGNIPAGTYFYRVCPIVDGEEKATNKMSKVIIAADGGKVSLSWPSVSIASSYKVYRSNDPTFPSPSYLGSVPSNSYVDAAAQANEGSPPESYGSPYIWFISSTVKILPLSGRLDQQATDKGIVSIERRVAFISGSLNVNALDKINLDSVEYEVYAVQPYFLNNVAIYKKIVLTRMIE